MSTGFRQASIRWAQIGNFGNGYERLGPQALYRLASGSKSCPEQDLLDPALFAQAPVLILYYSRNTFGV